MPDFFYTVNTWISGNLAAAALGSFLWGVISVIFSPCHLASIPLMVSYTAGQDQAANPRTAAKYALAFTAGLFTTIAAVGLVCSLLGRMLGEISPYWTILVGALLIWVALGVWGVEACSVSGSGLGRFRVKGVTGALVLGLAYGVMSGTCTFGFIAPVLAIITVQEKIAAGVVLIILFGIGHCAPIAAAGTSMALVRKTLENQTLSNVTTWFRKISAAAIAAMGIYFTAKPFL